MHPMFDSAQLYHACQSSEASVQESAYRSLWTYLYQIAYQIVQDQADADALAQECTQRALVRVYQRLIECREPAAFRTWTRRIVSHLAIDELRRQRRLQPLPEDEETRSPFPHAIAAPEQTVLATLHQAELRSLLELAPLSERSRRLVIGRYLDDTDDEELAQVESHLTGQPVLPSHLQVTRAKNIAKLRQWERLRDYLAPRGTE